MRCNNKAKDYSSSNSLEKGRSYGKTITDPDQPFNAVKMFKVKQEKECLLPAEKWVWEVIRSIF